MFLGVGIMQIEKGLTMAKNKRKPLPVLDGVAFLQTCEQMLADGNADYVSLSLPKLKKYVRMYQNRIHQLEEIQSRARSIIKRHEPSEDDRLKVRPEGDP